MLPCKICEKEVPAEKLSLHSQKCRDVTESKEILTSIIAKMESHGEQAQAMKNALETNATKEKKKQTKKTSFKDLMDSTPAGHHRSSSGSQSGASPTKNQLAGENEALNSDGDRIDSGTRENLSTRETVDNQDDTPSAIRMSEGQYRKFVEEVNKGMVVLKKIMTYTKNIVDWALETSALCDVGRNTQTELEEDEKEIVDENVLKFLRGFITDLELYIQTRERYVGASHELAKLSSPKAYKDLKHKFFTKRSTSIANLKPDSGNIKESSFFRRMDDCASAVTIKKESPVDKRKLSETGASSPTLQKRSLIKQMTGLSGFAVGSGTPTGTSVAPSPSMKTLKSDFSKMLLQTNVNHVHGASNFMSMANLKKNTEDVSNLRDKIKASLNINTMEKSNVMAESGLMSPNLAVLNQKNKAKGKLTITTNSTLSAFARKADQKAQPNQMESPAQTPKKRTMSQGWFKTLRNEDSKGLGGFGSEEKTPKTPTSTSEPIFTMSPAQNSKAKKVDEKPEFVESLRGYYSDCGPSRRKQLLHVNSNSQDVSFDDFQIIKFIGKGAYGEVWLVKKKATGDFYAMKTVDWSNKAVQSKLKDIKAEKDIYQALEGDFVVKAFWTFHHENLICFVTEYMLGGDFNRILDRLARLDEDQAKFYFAELVLAVESLHNLKVVHRDLKPDNILMDAKGHIRLTDFGLSQNEINKFKPASNPGSRESLSPKVDDSLSQARSSLNKFCKTPSGSLPKAKVDFKQNSKKSKVVFDFLGKNEYHQVIEKKPMLKKVKDSPTQHNKKPKMVGTPDYMAPEIIAPENYELEGYDEKCMDWWSMGVILYQFLVGMPAFCDTSIEAVFDNIKHHRMEWPPIGDEEDCISHESADLIKQLLNPDPKKRLGAKGSDEVKNHPFFKGVDWKTLREREAPIIPCSLDDEQSTPMQTPKTFETGLNSPMIMRTNRPKTAKPIDFGAFRMRRLDLLDEANQQTHKDFQRQNSTKIKL